MAARRGGGRRRARGRRARQGLPDWAWGLALGVIAVLVFGGGYLVVTGLGGGGGDSCDQALAPLETSDISARGFAEEIAGLGRVIEAANRGDIAAAESAFYGPVHNFTHNADPPIREQDPDLAKRLCRAVLQIEDDLVSNPAPLRIAGDAQRIQELLREGARALGFSVP